MLIDIKDINKKLLISIINQIKNKSVKDKDKKEEDKIINIIKKLNKFLLIRIYLIKIEFLLIGLIIEIKLKWF